MVTPDNKQPKIDSASHHPSGSMSPPDSGPAPLLELENISKSFPGCLANDRINMQIVPGKIHALLGENGAGKSTLVNIIYGVLQPSGGTIRWRGEAVTVASPAIARSMGIAMVFQHFSLFDSLTVLDNIALGLNGSRPESLAADIRLLSERYGLPLDPDRYVYTLSVGERQRIEIIRCLLQNPDVLIMDEPTSVLTPQEVGKLFDTLRRLAAEGVAIIYISHKLHEIQSLCDEATILRQGKHVASAVPANESARSLAGLMMGKALQPAIQPSNSSFGNVLLEVDGLVGLGVKQVELSVRAGEILGIAGVAGNGQDDLMDLLSGEVIASDQAMVRFKGEPIGWLSASQRRAQGLCFVPEQRLGHAAVPDMSLSENAFLTAHHRLALRAAGFLRFAPTRLFSRKIIDRFQVQCRSERAVASSLSGGNLQKFVVGREILQKPEVLIVAQPTWGVDAGAAAFIHEALVSLAEGGSAIVVVSQDLDELRSLCHTLMALCGGRGSAQYPAASLSLDQIGMLMAGSPLNDVPADSMVTGASQ